MDDHMLLALLIVGNVVAVMVILSIAALAIANGLEVPETRRARIRRRLRS